MLALPEKDTADILLYAVRILLADEHRPQAHLILLLVIASPLNLCFILRLYASLA